MRTAPTNAQLPHRRPAIMAMTVAAANDVAAWKLGNEYPVLLTPITALTPMPAS